MCLFLFGAFGINPPLALRVHAINFGLLAHIKEQMSISDNNNGSNTSVFSSTIFQRQKCYF